ncbi:hypothetical protein SAMN06265365_14218 [Tistlia consotensis]|uniref:Uncharacterized protein n=1 Tax=Tistlia consotensis USBA 355 TaxID=560819 RepID=A0A1Y6CQP0_9PROT|nr:hypothetical protein [Tistlia consotensis]SMF82045.1 hypothetical protein SAMN05428998_14518 [Tistlia consotensis USBA 355]SNS25235.1 hypothetical protein SAMN06265365_14218 [Tistlia consotensis]
MAERPEESDLDPPELAPDDPLAIVAMAALGRLAPAMARKARAGAPDGRAARALGYLLRLAESEIRFEEFDRRFWRRAAERHGARAWLALGEVLLKQRTGFDWSVGPLAYLGGVLKHGLERGTSAAGCRPEVSIERILAGSAAR